MEKQKCPRCKVNLPLEHFKVKRDGDRMKSCELCLQRESKYRNESRCIHDKRKAVCKDCGGSQICKHDKIKSFCKDCGGAQICEHDKPRSRCKECGGGSICEHNKRRDTCKECDFGSYLNGIVRSQTARSLKSNKGKKSLEYLGCDIETFRKHIEEQFEEGMSWDNYGRSSPRSRRWEIDHITPIKYGDPALEEVVERLHYTNTQPLWGDENVSKGNRYVGKPKKSKNK